VQLKKIFIFGLVGIFNNVLGYILYLFMTYIGVFPKIAATLIYVIGAFLSFLGNGRYVFNKIKKEKFKKITRYIFIYFLGYFINIGIHFLLVNILEYPHEVAQIGAIFIVAIYMFIGLSKYVFYEKEVRK